MPEELILERLRRIDDKLEALMGGMRSVREDMASVKARLELLEYGQAGILRYLDRLLALAERENGRIRTIEGRLSALERV